MHVHPTEHDPNAGVNQLDRVRAQLDALDQDLLDAARDRIRCCVRIAEVKRRHDISMMQPQRIAHVHERAASYGVDAGFLDRL